MSKFKSIPVDFLTQVVLVLPSQGSALLVNCLNISKEFSGLQVDYIGTLKLKFLWRFQCNFLL